MISFYQLEKVETLDRFCLIKQHNSNYLYH